MRNVLLTLAHPRPVPLADNARPHTPGDRPTRGTAPPILHAARRAAPLDDRGGMGLGLVIVAELTTLLGGCYGMESQARGSRFYVQLLSTNPLLTDLEETTLDKEPIAAPLVLVLWLIGGFTSSYDRTHSIPPCMWVCQDAAT